ncbi:MAG: replicative DNA helicase [Planctomycetaceae bacterium]
MKPDEIKMPPQNLAAEQSVLRAILLNNDVVDDALAEMSADDIYAPAHQIIFAVMLDLIRDDKPATALTVAEELERLGRLNDVGGWEQLFNLLNSLPTELAHVRHHARLIREAAQCRRIIYATADLQAAAYARTESDELLAMFDSAQRQISEREESRGCVSMFDVLHKRRDSLAKNDRGQVPTGWPDLDDTLGGGLRAGSLVIVGARPSVGKTSAALGMALAAAQEKLPAVFVTLEQSQIDIANRLLSAITGLSFADIELDRLIDPLDRDRLSEAENQLANLPLKIIDESSSRLSQIVASARAERRHGLRLLILDYLQLLRPDDDRVHREQQVAAMSRALKRLARELDAVVVCLAQLNRDIESRDRKQPRLSDLRESGSIEQDADVVLFLDRPAAYDPDAHPSEASILVAKNRNGPCGKVPLVWCGSTMTYRSAAQPWDACAFANSAGMATRNGHALTNRDR